MQFKKVSSTKSLTLSELAKMLGNSIEKNIEMAILE